MSNSASSEGDHEPTTTLLVRLRSSSLSAFGKLMDRFLPWARSRARRRLGPSLRQVGDSEQLAYDAFASLWRYVQRDKVQENGLLDRSGFLRLLGTITDRKVTREFRRHKQQKRDGQARREADLPAPEGESPVQTAVDPRPSPEWQAAFQDVVDNLLARLPPDLRQTVQRRLEGHTVPEIASQLTCSKRTVERKLMAVRKIWDEEDVCMLLLGSE